MKASPKGFSLIELMVVLVIIGVLVAIAVPSYKNYMIRAHRSSAQSFMMQIANKQTQYILDARNYAVGSGALGSTALNLTVPPDVTPLYTVVVENSSGGSTVENPPKFTVRATPIAGTQQAADGVLILTHDGTKTRGGTPGW
jgi:type IV pilus assembly protein PilE